jgi:lysophospholipase L1-like esterase
MVVQLVKPVLAPVLMAQAKRLRRLALELPEPPGERAGLARAGDVMIPAGARRPWSVLIAGDSSAAGVGAQTQSEALAPQLAAALAARTGRDVAWQLVAETGRTSAGVYELLRDAPLPALDAAIVIVGVNDISNDVAIGHALRVRNRIVRHLRAETGVSHVLFPGLPAVERFPLLPQPLAWYGGAQARLSDRMQARWAAHPKRRDYVSHLPMDGFTHPQLMAEDGFHPGPALYTMVAAHFAAHLAQRLAGD